jgi:hypothetical protein
MPSPAGVRRFQELYRQRFGEPLDDAQALDLATRYLHLYYFGTTRPPQPASLLQPEDRRTGPTV